MIKVLPIVNTEREKKTKTDKVTKIQAITYTDIRFREQNLLSFSCFRKEAGIFSALYFNKCGSFDPIDNVQIYINFGVLTVTLLIEVHVKRFWTVVCPFCTFGLCYYPGDRWMSRFQFFSKYKK